MDAKKIQEIWDNIDYERTRNSPPEGFPKLPEIPGKRYTDINLYNLEMEKIFYKSWLMVFREDEIPNPGDYKIWNKLNKDILVVRQKDLSIKAFYNTCMHRGAPVVRDSKGNTNLLRCQYHSWTYDLSGDLVKVPDMRDFKDFDISCKKLKKVFCDTWGGWVYISLSDNDPGDLINFLNPVAKELECFNSSDLITVYKKNVTVKANWKTCLDAFMEVYHAPTIHKDTVNILLDGNAMAAGLLKNGHSRMVTPKKMNLDGGFLGAEESDYVPYIETCDKIHAQTNVAYGMFPNFKTATDNSGYQPILFWTKGLRESEFEWTQLAPKWPGDEKPDYWNEQETSFDSIMDEDFQNLEPMQRSHDAGVFESMPLNYQERRIYYYHQVIDDWIGRDNLPENIQVPNILDPFIEI